MYNFWQYIQSILYVCQAAFDLAHETQGSLDLGD